MALLSHKDGNSKKPPMWKKEGPNSFENNRSKTEIMGFFVIKIVYLLISSSAKKS
jgi:hypothetical protein